MVKDMKKRLIEAVIIFVALSAVFAIANGLFDRVEKRQEERGFITIDGVKYYKDIKKLNLLLLKGDGFENISELNELQSLTIIPYAAKISDEEYQTKKDIYDKYTKVEDISCVAGLEKLTYLSVKDCRIKSLDCISELDRLETLDAANTDITEINVLPKLENLKALYISGCKITDFSPVYNMPSLEKLYVDSVQKELIDIDMAEKCGINVILAQ